MGLAPWTWFFVRDLSPYLEVVAVLLPALGVLGAVALTAASGITRRRRILAAAASWVAFTAVAVFLPWLPISTGTPVAGVTVAVANVLTDNPTPAKAAADLLAIDADVLVVPEDTPAVHRILAAEYPYRRRQVGNRAWTGVYSRLPLASMPSPPDLFHRDRYARLRIGGSEPFVLWALHLARPWFVAEYPFQMRPRQHAATLEAIAEAIEEEDLPVVVAGDLNLTDRGRGYRRITRHLDDATRSIAGNRTALKALFRPLLLRIDHILEPTDWCADRARRFEITGSDHRGVTARVGPCAPG